jgi:acetylornithine deacetylase
MPSPSDVRAILERLIAFDTTSRNSNLALIEWVEHFLSSRGVPSHRVASPDGAKSNLYALIGPRVEGGVVLSGHTDVVPVDGQPWSSDPWTLTERDGKLYGRGVADMKSFLALCLAHVDEALAADLKRPLILAFSYDEEVGCLGAPAMIEEIKRTMPAPSAVIVGEPSEMRVISGHKGIRVYEVEVTGREAHSSQIHHGVSAVMEALGLMNEVAEIAAEQDHSDSSSAFDPPGATLTIGKVDGGTASNILARSCTFVWDLRTPPHVDPDVIEQRFMAEAARVDAAIKARAPEGGVIVRRRSNTPAMAPALDSAAEALSRALTGDNGLIAAAYAAEGGLFQGAGLPAVICGPGSILQAHQPDEWIEISQLDEGAAFLQKLIARLS